MGRLNERAVDEKEAVVVLARADHVHAPQVRRLDLVLHPALAVVAEPEEPAGHVVEDRDEHVALRRGRGLDRLPARRREDRLEVAAPGEKVVVVDGEERAGRVRPPARLPVGPEVDRQVLADEAGVGVEREVEAHELAAVEDVVGRLEKGRPVDDDGDGRAAPAERGRPRADVRGLALKDRLGLFEGRLARPPLDEAGVARGRHRGRAKVRRHEERVPVDPGRRALGLRQEKAALDERLRLDVELAGLRGVGPAAREADEAPRVVGREARRAGERPAHALGLRQPVDVEERLPVRLAREVGVPRRPAPQAARVLRVRPRSCRATRRGSRGRRSARPSSGARARGRGRPRSRARPGGRRASPRSGPRPQASAESPSTSSSQRNGSSWAVTGAARSRRRARPAERMAGAAGRGR